MTTFSILDRPPTAQTNAISALEIYEGYFAFLPSAPLTINRPQGVRCSPTLSLRIRRLSGFRTISRPRRNLRLSSLSLLISFFYSCSTLWRNPRFSPFSPSFWSDHSGMLVVEGRGIDWTSEGKRWKTIGKRSAEKWAKWEENINRDGRLILKKVNCKS